MKERRVKTSDGKELPITAPNDIADFMENLASEIYGKQKLINGKKSTKEKTE